MLNDEKAVHQLNALVDAGRQRFALLPDPAPATHFATAEDDERDLREVYGLDSDRCIFLFTGTVSKRKGILETLDAFTTLTPEQQSRCALVIAGRLKEDAKEPVRRRIAELQNNSLVEVRTDFRFLTGTEMQRAFKGCDIIMVPYTRTEGSSGILGHAASVNRAVIGPQSGLIGELIRQYELGVCVNTNSPEDIGSAIASAINGRIKSNHETMRRYLRERSPSHFAQIILFSADC